MNVSRVKVLTFGVCSRASPASAARSSPSTAAAAVPAVLHDRCVSIYFLVAIVVGGAASIVGPAIGAVFYGVFIDVITPELPESLQAGDAPHPRGHC